MGTDPTWDYFNGRHGRKHRAAVLANMTNDKAQEIMVRATLGHGTAHTLATTNIAIPAAFDPKPSVGFTRSGLVLLALMLPDSEVATNVRRLLMPLDALNIPTAVL